MITSAPILRAIEQEAANLQVSGPFDRRAILAAFTDVESGPWGARAEAGLFEDRYYRGGTYYRRHVIELVHKYESLAACSYGPWQVLFPTAFELGYRGHPVGLLEPAICAVYCVKILNGRVADKSALENFTDGYNTGNDRDRVLPATNYTENFIQAYDEALEWYAAKDGGLTA